MILRNLLAAIALTLSTVALADRSDRDKPVNLEADKVSVDDAKKRLVFEGNVLLTQGTMSIRAQRLVVTQDAQGFQHGTAYGPPGGVAHFKQKREGRDDFIEGQAERIEHDARGEKTEFFNRARVKSGGDEVTGNYISFDGLSERYTVTGASVEGKAGSGEGRVRATIQPKQDAKPGAK